MNIPLRFRAPVRRAAFLAFATGLLAAASLAPAQGVAPAEDKDLLRLSPFVVNEAQEFGYAATSTLAGSRLNTPLRDVGSAISVLTKDFFRDTGATDAESVLAYALNMDVSGSQGNFAGATASTTGTMDVTEIRRNPQANGQRVRGLAKASLTRNFFLTDIPFDEYNTTVVSINRGPNSLLFGIGEPGGIIDQGLKKAELGSNFGDVSVRVGAQASMRETFDYNRVVARDRLAIRIAGVHDTTNYRQRPAFKRDERFYTALNAVVLENKNSGVLGPTSLRGSFEQGHIRGTPPNIIPPTDGLSPWFGLPNYSANQLAALNGGRLPAQLSWIANGAFVPKLTVDIRNGSVATGIPNSGRSPFFFNMPITYNDPGATLPSVGLADASIQGVIGRVRWNQLNPRHPTYRAQVDFLSLGPLEADIYTPGYTSPVIQNFGVVNNERLLLSGTTNRVAQDFKASSVALEQILFQGKGGIEVAYDFQKYKNWSQLPYSTARDNIIWIDINRYLPNTEPNPNVGRPFMIARSANGGGPDVVESKSRRDSYRATAFYELDLRDRNDKLNWLGRNILTAFHGRQKVNTISRTYRQAWLDASGATDVARSLSGDLAQERRWAPYVNYIGPSLLGNSVNSLNDVRLTQYIQNPMAQPGDRFRVTYSDFTAPRTNPANGMPLFSDTFEIYNSLVTGSVRKQDIRSDVLSWQGYWARGHLVGMVGWRKDRAENFGGSGSAALPTGEYDPANLRLISKPAVDEGNTLTKSLVAHVPRAWLKLPLGSELSVHYNQSENFAPQGVRRNVLNESLAPPSGTTKEYGFSVEVLERRLSLRLNRYETESSGISTSLDGAIDLVGGGMIVDWLGRWREAEVSGLSVDQAVVAAGGKAGLFPSHQAVYDTIVGLVPAKFQGSYNFRFATPTSQTVLWNQIDGLTATTSFVSKGLELELAGSVTRNWGLLLNVGRQETVRSNTAPAAAELAFAIRDNLVTSKLNGLLDSPTRGDLSTFNVRYARRALNALVGAVSRDGQVSQEQRKWRANVVSTYTFNKNTPLDGFSLGGAVRWQGRVATGYPILEVNEGVVTPDLQHPYFGPSEWNGDVWVSYTHRIGKNIRWKTQLNVRNAIGDNDPIPVLTNPDGRVAVIRNSNPREIFLTNTFSF